MGANQFTSAELLVNELKVGIKACKGGNQVVPESSKLAQLLYKSISGNDHRKSE